MLVYSLNCLTHVWGSTLLTLTLAPLRISQASIGIMTIASILVRHFFWKSFFIEWRLKILPNFTLKCTLLFLVLHFIWNHFEKNRFHRNLIETLEVLKSFPPEIKPIIFFSWSGYCCPDRHHFSRSRYLFPIRLEEVVDDVAASARNLDHYFRGLNLDRWQERQQRRYKKIFFHRV